MPFQTFEWTFALVFTNTGCYISLFLAMQAQNFPLYIYSLLLQSLVGSNPRGGMDVFVL